MNKGYTHASCNKHACMHHISYKKLSTPMYSLLFNCFTAKPKKR